MHVLFIFEMKAIFQPGLNAGLPLIAKKDPIHEKTFMMHDLGHFLMKDLIFTGRDTPLHRSVYIAARMISEAVTIMLADGVFVDILRRSGVDYDFTTRKIYPLVVATGLEFNNRESFLSNLRTLMKASVDYTVKGDDSAFLRLIAGGDTSCLEDYKAKFLPFFVSDFEWTAHNYENMVSRAEEMRKWWELSKPVRDLLDLPLESIDEFIGAMQAKSEIVHTHTDMPDDVSGVVDLVFDTIFDRSIAPVFGREIVLKDAALRSRRGFLRYIIGQMGVYARFSSFSENAVHFDEIIELLMEGRDGSPISISAVRASYEKYVDLLATNNLISSDDAHNYRDIYPLFEPFYVSYDKHEAYPDLALTAYKLLDFKAQRSSQVQFCVEIVWRIFFHCNFAGVVSRKILGSYYDFS